MPFEFRQPTTPDQQVNRAAERLHELSFSGQPADDKMRKEVEQLNQKYAGNKGVLSQIGEEYKALSKNDSLFSQEVKVGADGSLTFKANDVISKELRGFSVQAAKELKAIHALDRKMDAEEENGNYKQLDKDEKAWAKLSKQIATTQKDMEHEEHLLAAAPMDPKGVVINGIGYNQFQRDAMQNLVDKSVHTDENINLNRNTTRFHTHYEGAAYTPESYAYPRAQGPFSTGENPYAVRMPNIYSSKDIWTNYDY